ncbi:orotidine-5'-phosphate decarboxylase [Parvicella tangerina]|uniref:Orotidine-5'-phosphate decarboxylase n=1 Tax=Parvicella tangerina TaxID=2829795 RepID=A0A916N9Y9_9FLAO|nr:orotidine-5'-phosphate decarboxylase [Parvicella tangerina]CAG5078118.1 Orotidine 5'-phosphate decarboxylase [Parvicella tangerina]
MTREDLIAEIKTKKSFLCVGLDSDLKRLPKHLLKTENPILEFNKQIIEATKDYCVAYKPNIAFYESMGPEGWRVLEETIQYIPSNKFIIADAKRGDIGNTSKMYAKTFFETYNFDAITVAPYMGEDSVTPYFGFDSKWVILLAATSNSGGLDFQYKSLTNGKMLFEEVLEKSKEWGDSRNIMYVVGATRADILQKVRAIVPDNFLLVPGVGAQGGSLRKVVENGMNSACGLLVNSSRGIIYADDSERFAEVAGEKAKELQQEMENYLKEYSVI